MDHRHFKKLLPLALIAVSVAGCGGGDEKAQPAGGTVEPAAARPIQVGGSPIAVAAGGGAVWVADNTGGTVSRIDPTTGAVDRDPIRVGSGPEAIAVGGGGVYVACGDDSVWRIDPTTGEATRAPVTIGDPAGLAVGDGEVWVTSASEGTVARLDLATLALQGEPIAVGAQPGDVVVGDGRAWVADVRDGTVSGIDTSSGEVVTTVDAGEFGVFALALADESLLAARTDDRLAREIQLVHIDQGSGEIEGDGADVPGAVIPIRLAAGEGAVWVTIAGGPAPPNFEERPAQIAYLADGESDLASRRIGVGQRPTGIAVGYGRVWVASADHGTVTPIDAQG
jgi:DNA-binding beta-propeller fold protein YncE